MDAWEFITCGVVLGISLVWACVLAWIGYRRREIMRKCKEELEEWANTLPNDGPWQAIETCPKDVFVILWYPGINFAAVRMYVGDNKPSTNPTFPTHWMALPEPPKHSPQ